MEEQDYITGAVQIVNDSLGRKDRASLTELVQSTQYLVAVSKPDWVGAIIGITRDWDEGIRPSPDECLKCCDFYGSTFLFEEAQAEDKPVALNARSLINQHREYRKPVIEGLLRQGETMNIIASPKVGKSWLVLSLAVSMSNGNPWLGMETQRCNVLLVDNELHVETLAQRLRGVAMEQGEALDCLSVLPLRGRSKPLNVIRDLVVGEARKNKCGLIILDALYRFLPEGVSENDNAAMTALYNTIDQMAKESECSIILIHHSSKGNQADKSVTDGGAGAGAVSRAADAHVFLREHDEEGCAVFAAVARSFPPMEPFVIQGQYVDHAKVWTTAKHLDPGCLKGRKEERGPAPISAVHPAMLRDHFLLPRNETPLKIAVDDAAATLNATKSSVRLAFEKAHQDGMVNIYTVRSAKMVIATL